MLSKLRNLGWVAVGAIVLYWAATTLVGTVFSGPLDPPAAPGPTQKTQIASLPYTITAPGSYILMSNLTCTSCSVTDGISIDADNVTLDLNGFALLGLGAGGGDGIEVVGTQWNIRVMNGSVSGWGGRGIRMITARNSSLTGIRATDNLIGITVGQGVAVSDCAAADNLTNGIELGVGSRLNNCSASLNGVTGIIMGSTSIASNCSATQNAVGILAGDDVAIDHCQSSENTSEGFNLGEGSVITNCVAAGNNQTGILAAARAIITDCVAKDNVLHGILVSSDAATITNNLATDNGATGIRFGGNSLVLNNNVEGNTLNGISTSGTGSRIEGNHATANGVIGFSIAAAENVVVKNTAHGNTAANYNIDPLSVWGPIVVGTGGVLPAGIHPWANFEY